MTESALAVALAPLWLWTAATALTLAAALYGPCWAAQGPQR